MSPREVFRASTDDVDNGDRFFLLTAMWDISDFYQLVDKILIDQSARVDDRDMLCIKVSGYPHFMIVTGLTPQDGDRMSLEAISHADPSNGIAYMQCPTESNVLATICTSGAIYFSIVSDSELSAYRDIPHNRVLYTKHTTRYCGVLLPTRGFTEATGPFTEAAWKQIVPQNVDLHGYTNSALDHSIVLSRVIKAVIDHVLKSTLPVFYGHGSKITYEIDTSQFGYQALLQDIRVLLMSHRYEASSVFMAAALAFIYYKEDQSFSQSIRKAVEDCTQNSG